MYSEIQQIMNEIFIEPGITNLILGLKFQMEDLDECNTFIFENHEETETKKIYTYRFNVADCVERLFKIFGKEEFRSWKKIVRGVMMCVAGFSFFKKNEVIDTIVFYFNNYNPDIHFYNRNARDGNRNSPDGFYISEEGDGMSLYIFNSIDDEKIKKIYYSLEERTQSFTRFLDKIEMVSYLRIDEDLIGSEKVNFPEYMAAHPGPVSDMYTMRRYQERYIKNVIVKRMLKFFIHVIKRCECYNSLKYHNAENNTSMIPLLSHFIRGINNRG